MFLPSVPEAMSLKRPAASHTGADKKRREEQDTYDNSSVRQVLQTAVARSQPILFYASLRGPARFACQHPQRHEVIHGQRWRVREAHSVPEEWYIPESRDEGKPAALVSGDEGKLAATVSGGNSNSRIRASLAAKLKTRLRSKKHGSQRKRRSPRSPRAASHSSSSSAPVERGRSGDRATS